VLDTNVLLNVLRFSPDGRRELLRAFESVAHKCHIPHQVASEFNRNRVKVVSDRRKELTDLAKEVESAQAAAKGIITRLKGRSALGSGDTAALEESAGDFFRALAAAQTEAVDRYDLDPDRMVGIKDPWTLELERIFAGRVGEPPDASDVQIDTQEAERRKLAKLAPGFKDASRGDYLWWAQALRAGTLRGKVLMVVSDDAAKGDWRYEERDLSAGPQSILIDDVRQAGGVGLVLVTTRELLQLVGDLEPDRVVSEATLAELSHLVDARPSQWNEATFERLLEKLTDGGYGDRVDAITSAAQSGGFVSRETVYGILGCGEDARSLRHFATPVQRARQELIDEGLLDPDAEPALRAVYAGPGKTVGYQVPPEFQDFALWEPDPDMMPGGKDWD
jgi:hypothetical protein